MRKIPTAEQIRSYVSDELKNSMPLGSITPGSAMEAFIEALAVVHADTLIDVFVRLTTAEELDNRFEVPDQTKVCDHKWVEVGFTDIKTVCKNCDMEKV